MELIPFSAEELSKNPILKRQMLELRADVFGHRLGWKVIICDGKEWDRFDNEYANYLLYIIDNVLVGCARLIPTHVPYMLEEMFPQLAGDSTLPKSDRVVESSRFCIDNAFVRDRLSHQRGALSKFMFESIAAWSRAQGYEEVVTVTDIRMERLIRASGLIFRRLAPPKKVGSTTAVAGIIPTAPVFYEGEDRPAP